MDLGPTCARFGKVDLRVRRRLPDDEPIKLRVLLSEQQEGAIIEDVGRAGFGDFSDRLSALKGLNNPPRLLLRHAAPKLGEPLVARKAFSLMTAMAHIQI